MAIYTRGVMDYLWKGLQEQAAEMERKVAIERAAFSRMLRQECFYCGQDNTLPVPRNPSGCFDSVNLVAACPRCRELLDDPAAFVQHVLVTTDDRDYSREFVDRYTELFRRYVAEGALSMMHSGAGWYDYFGVPLAPQSDDTWAIIHQPCAACGAQAGKSVLDCCGDRHHLLVRAGALPDGRDTTIPRGCSETVVACLPCACRIDPALARDVVRGHPYAAVLWAGR